MSPACYSQSPHLRPRLKRPSSSILAVLGTIAAAANAKSAPLPFLCPSLHTETTPSPEPHPAPTLAPRSVHRPGLKPRDLPDKYEIQNGVWRRVNVWSLYGSTVCGVRPVLRSLSARHFSFSFAQDCDKNHQSETATVENNQTISTLPNNVPGSYDIRDTLPPGWKPRNSPGGTTRMTLIIGLSLVLSIAICLLIVFCVHHRKSKRRKRLRDVEKRGTKRHRPDQSSSDDSRARDLIILKELKMKQKLWSKATARWKDNVRYSARLRRGKRHHVAVQTSSDDELGDERQTLQTVTSLSCHSTIESASTHRPPTIHLDSSIPARDPNSFSSVFRVSPPPASPPAYDRRASTSVAPITTGDDRLGGSNQRFLTSYSPASISGPQFTPIPHAAHVATDDKALLAHMANLASSPPTEASHPSQMASIHLEVSAPFLDDDGLEDYLYDSDSLSGLDRSAHSSRSPFPPPPSKGQLATYSYYHYRYSYEDIARESDIGASAPPFEEGQPSCPPLDDFEALASAPPLPTPDQFEAHSSSRDPCQALDHPPSTKDPGDHESHHLKRPDGGTGMCREDNCIPPAHGCGLALDKILPSTS